MLLLCFYSRFAGVGCGSFSEGVIGLTNYPSSPPANGKNAVDILEIYLIIIEISVQKINKISDKMRCKYIFKWLTYTA